MRALATVMIASPASRGKGCGSEAVRLMMAYGTRRLNASKFIVKIGAANAASIAMFTKLGFGNFEYLEWCDEQHGSSPVMGDEVALRETTLEEWLASL